MLVRKLVQLPLPRSAYDLRAEFLRPRPGLMSGGVHRHLRTTGPSFCDSDVWQHCTFARIVTLNDVDELKAGQGRQPDDGCHRGLPAPSVYPGCDDAGAQAPNARRRRSAPKKQAQSDVRAPFARSAERVGRCRSTRLPGASAKPAAARPGSISVPPSGSAAGPLENEFVFFPPARRSQ